MSRTKILLFLAVVAVGAGQVVAGMASMLAAVTSPQAQFPNSLWIGTDNTQALSALNTDRNGALLRSVGPLQVTGFAIDLNANVIYFGTSIGGITRRDLPTQVSGPSWSAGGTEDMTFDGQYIWHAGAIGPAASPIIYKIDPVTHVSVQGFTVPFQALGIAWDGSGFWIAEFTFNGLIQRFDTAGNPTGPSFHTAINSTNGGLAYDPTDNTIYVGSFNKVFHYTTTGTLLGSFIIPGGDGRFVDGLEFEAGLGGVPAGRIPAGAPGVPMTLTKTGSDVTLQWGASCLVTDTDYEVYEGTLGSFTSHAPRLCATGGALTATITPLPGDRYFLVVPTNGTSEGSYGLQSGGAERPLGSSACFARMIGSCP